MGTVCGGTVVLNGINAKMRFLAQMKGRREKERERKRKGKEKGKGEREREIGSEALAETENIANAPAGNRTRNPSKRVVLNDLEEFGRFEADEKSISPQMPRSQMS